MFLISMHVALLVAGRWRDPGDVDKDDKVDCRPGYGVDTEIQIIVMRLQLLSLSGHVSHLVLESRTVESFSPRAVYRVIRPPSQGMHPM